MAPRADDLSRAGAAGIPWRLVGFAYVLQLTMVGIVGGFLWRIPRLVILTVAAVIGAGLWRYLVPERVKAWRGCPAGNGDRRAARLRGLTSLVHPTYRSVFEILPQNEP